MDNVAAVSIGQCYEYGLHEGFAGFKRHEDILLDERHEIFAWYVLEHEIELLVVLVELVHLGDVIAVQEGQGCLLLLYSLLALIIVFIQLLHDLDSILVVVLQFPGEVDLLK